MARRKVKLSFIVNDVQRKASFRNRREGLLKKATELSTLCGIDACAIIYSPYENEPDVWPNHPGVHGIIAKFKEMPEMVQNKKMLDSESLIRKRTTKVNEWLKKHLKDNREEDMITLMYQCLAGRQLQNLVTRDLDDLDRAIDKSLDEIKNIIATLKIVPTQEGESSGTTLQNVGLQEEKHDVDLAADEDMQMPEWVNEWINATDEQIKFDLADEEMMPFNDADNNGSMLPFNDANSNFSMMPFNDAGDNGIMFPFNDANNNGSMMPFSYGSKNYNMMQFNDANNNGIIMPLSEASNNCSMMPVNDANNNGNMMPVNDANDNGNMMPFDDATNNGNIWPGDFLP